ncbi:MAG: DUF4129 domain-containing protein, partial [Dehalococcoidia bacterium]
MSVRLAGLELMSLAALTLAVYAGTALLVAGMGEGQAVSFAAAAAIVVPSYLLARTLRGANASLLRLRFAGVATSVLLLLVVMRLEFVGDPYVWRLGWLADLLSNPGVALEGRAGSVTEVILLVAALLIGIGRGAQPISAARLHAESSAGLVVVLCAAALAPAADAPQALRWIAVPYMLSTLSTLALVHMQQVEVDKGRPFLLAWVAWPGGPLLAITGVAVLANAAGLPSPEKTLDGIKLGLFALAIAAVAVLTPFIIAATFILELFAHLLGGGGDRALPDLSNTPPVREQPESSGATSVWELAIGSGVAALAVLAALAIAWLSFRKFSGGSKDAERSEEIGRAEDSPAGGLLDLLAGALDRLRGPGRARSRDAIGRLYVSMLRRAANDGFARPPAATPGEFGPALQAHFGSALPLAISDAYVRARYAARFPSDEEVRRLRVEWRTL